MLFKHTRYRILAGFSLLEMSIAIAIISVVAVMGLEATSMYLSRVAYQATQERMVTIDAAIKKYRYVYGRLPCPVPLTVAITDAGNRITKDYVGASEVSHAGYGKEDCANAATLSGGVSYVEILNPGLGYQQGFMVPLNGSSTGSGAMGFVTINALGTITSSKVVHGGTGYMTTDTDLTPDFSAGKVTGTTEADGCTNTILDGKVSTFTCTNNGLGYQASSTGFPVTFTGGGGTGAAGIANIDTTTGAGAQTGQILSITITNPGYGYTSDPTIDLSAGVVSTTFAAITTLSRSAIRFGGLPVRDLGLPLSYALDAYGSKFLYYVTDTLSNSATTTTSFKPATGVIQVRSGALAAPQLLMPNAAYAFLSVGPDQRGGYNQRGMRINDCIPTTGYSSAIDAQNCIAQGSSAVNPIAINPANIPQGVLYNSTFSNGTPSSTYFDDLVIFHAKSEL